MAADDFAQVFVNGTSVGTTGSTTNISLAFLAQSQLATFDITSFLVTGTNVISVRAKNGVFGCGAGAYSCNPAGVVYGGSLQFVTVPLLIGSVQALVNAGILNQGQGDSLISKLERAIESLNQGNTIAACSQLLAFINEVAAYIDAGILTAGQGQPLINAATSLRNSLGC